MSEGMLTRQSLQNLKCHLCGKYLSVGPIKSVSLKGDQNQCGRCAEIPSEYNIINFCFEKVAPYLRFPCTFEGCKQVLSWNEVENHEVECEHATFQCPQLFCDKIIGIKTLSHHMFNHNYFVDKIENYVVVDNRNYVLFLMKDAQIFFIFICHDNCFLYVGVYASQKLTSNTYFEVTFLSPKDKPLIHLSYKSKVLEYNDNHCFKCMSGYCNLKHHKYSTHYSRSKKNLRRVVVQIDFEALKKILNVSQVEFSLYVREDNVNDVSTQTDSSVDATAVDLKSCTNSTM